MALGVYYTLCIGPFCICQMSNNNLKFFLRVISFTMMAADVICAGTYL